MNKLNVFRGILIGSAFSLIFWYGMYLVFSNFSKVEKKNKDVPKKEFVFLDGNQPNTFTNI